MITKQKETTNINSERILCKRARYLNLLYTLTELKCYYTTNLSFHLGEVHDSIHSEFFVKFV